MKTDRDIRDMSLFVSDLFSKINTQKHVGTYSNWLGGQG